MFEVLDNLEDELHGLVRALDPHALTPGEAADALHGFAVLARIATTGLARLADRAGECTRWRQRDFPDVGSWVADELGATVSDGRRLHTASTRPDLCPATWQLMARGTIAPLAGAEIIAAAVSTERARAAAVARAAAEADGRRAHAEKTASDVVPDVEEEPPEAPRPLELGKTVDDVERDLLDLAGDRRGTIRRLREEREKADAAARDETAAAIHAFLHRSVTFSQAHDGMGEARVRLSNDLMAVIRAVLDANANKLFRSGGRGTDGRAPSNANLLADALVLLLAGRLPAHPDGTTPGPTRRARPSRPGGGAAAGTPPVPETGGPPSGPTYAAAADPTDGVRAATSGPVPSAEDDADVVSADPPPRGFDIDAEPSGGGDLVDELPLDLRPEPEPEPEPATDPSATPGPIGVSTEATGEVVVRVDAFALARGVRLPGEACEIVGAGTISIDQARRLAAHACIDVVIHDRSGVTTVACTRRRLTRHLHPGPRPAPPPHRTRLVLLIDADTIRGSGDQLQLPGTGPVSRALLVRALPAAAIETIAACAVDPDTIDTDGRNYPRPLSVAVRETSPRCPRCGFDRWLQTDHVLALALGGRTTRANLARPCAWCHGAKTRAEAPATIRAGRRRRAREQQLATVADPPKRRTPRRRRPRVATPADDP